LSFHAGTGGVDAQDWAEMLMRMYLRYCELKGWKTSQLDLSTAEQAGIKSASFRVEGNYVYGYLKHEHGVHRLVRISPFNAKGTRETSLPWWTWQKSMKRVEIKDDDLDWAFSPVGRRSKRYKVSSEVASSTCPGLVDLPNRTQPTKIAKALGRLSSVAMQNHPPTEPNKSQNTCSTHGQSNRSYVLQPYQMVKDHRTDHETSQVDRVLNGDLDEFIEASLRA
jgi:peptide chain release factor 2